MRSKYLYKISLKFDWKYRGDNKSKLPVYVVAYDKNEAKSYAETYLKSGAYVKSVSQLGQQLGNSMFHGK